MEITPFPVPEGDPSERLRRASEQLQTLLQDMADTVDVELTRARQRIYIAALLPFHLGDVRGAMIRLLARWKWNSFPQLGEIIDEIHSKGRSFNQSLQANSAASEALAQRYIAARGQPKKLLPSVLDPATPEQLGRLPRERRLALGIDKPAAVDAVARVAELRRQAGALETRG